MPFCLDRFLLNVQTQAIWSLCVQEEHVCVDGVTRPLREGRREC